jgi:hypothetical protein
MFVARRQHLLQRCVIIRATQGSLCVRHEHNKIACCVASDACQSGRHTTTEESAKRSSLVLQRQEWIVACAIQGGRWA